MKNVESTFQSNIIAYIGLAKFVSSLFGYALRRCTYVVEHAGGSLLCGDRGGVDDDVAALHVREGGLADFCSTARTQSATKGAITTFTKSLALQLAPKAIPFSAVTEVVLMMTSPRFMCGRAALSKRNVGKVSNSPAIIADFCSTARTQSATKGAITTFTKSLALQLAPKEFE
jgi:NAD(P)-dependent dehydrogenase (short-subunit alcohol dehydrogenase family)